MEELSRPITFVIRAVRHPDGGVTGTVERVLTGQKARFRCANSLAEIIARMVASADDEPAAEPRGEEKP